jgi:hypothetical protein
VERVSARPASVTTAVIQNTFVRPSRSASRPAAAEPADPARYDTNSSPTTTAGSRNTSCTPGPGTPITPVAERFRGFVLASRAGRAYSVGER